MNPWLESLGVVLLAAGGTLIGAWFSRRPSPYWVLGYFIPLSMMCLYAAGSRDPAFTFVPPISWMMMGRTRFAIVGFIGAMLLTTPLSRLPRRRDRVGVCLLMVVIVSIISVWPFLAPAFNRQQLANLTTRMDADGVCLQSTVYTCGPASAVTALRRLGFKAEEGAIAILAHTSTAIGTPPDILANTLQTRYGNDGLVCEYRLFTNVSELPPSGLTLAVIQFSDMIDHYVTVLKVDNQKVTVGDPLNGLTELPKKEFEEKWRYCGIVMRRK